MTPPGAATVAGATRIVAVVSGRASCAFVGEDASRTRSRTRSTYCQGCKCLASLSTRRYGYLVAYYVANLSRNVLVNHNLAKKGPTRHTLGMNYEESYLGRMII